MCTYEVLWERECAYGRRGRFALPVARQQAETKALFFTQCTILSHYLSAEDSCIRLTADSSKAIGLIAAARRVNGGQQGPNSGGLYLLKTHMNRRRQQRGRKGDARAVRMRCMSNIYLFIIQH